MKSTADLCKPLAKWLTNVENQHHGAKLKMIRTDNGPEFTSDGFTNWARDKGIHIEYSETYTPELNGRSERSNRIWMDGVRAMLNDAKLPRKYWVFALKTKNYLLNRTGTTTNEQFKTPYEKLFDKKPKVSHLRVFGAKGHAQITKKKKKLQPRAEKIQLLGYAEDHEGYVVQYLKDKRIGVARTISVDEERDQSKIKRKRAKTVRFQDDENTADDVLVEIRDGDEDEEFASMETMICHKITKMMMNLHH